MLWCSNVMGLQRMECSPFAPLSAAGRGHRGRLSTKQVLERLDALRGGILQVLDYVHASVVVCVFVVHLPPGR